MIGKDIVIGKDGIGKDGIGKDGIGKDIVIGKVWVCDKNSVPLLIVNGILKFRC